MRSMVRSARAAAVFVQWGGITQALRLLVCAKYGEAAGLRG